MTIFHSLILGVKDISKEQKSNKADKEQAAKIPKEEKAEKYTKKESNQMPNKM